MSHLHPFELVAAGAPLFAAFRLMPRRRRPEPVPRALTRLEHAKREYVRSTVEPWTVEGREEIARLEADVEALVASGDDDSPWWPGGAWPGGLTMAQVMAGMARAAEARQRQASLRER